MLIASIYGKSEGRLHIDTRIASIYGNNVYYRDVRVDPKIFILSNTKKLSKDELDNLIRRSEINRFKGFILEKIIRRGIKNNKIYVSAEEINQEINKRIQTAGIDESFVLNVQNSYALLFEALELYMENPNQSNEIYESKLDTTSLSKESWEIIKYTYDTKEKIENLRAIIPINLLDMKSMGKKSVEEDLLREKLKEKITVNVTISEEELNEYWKNTNQSKLTTKNEREQESRKLLAMRKEKFWNEWVIDRVKASNLLIYEDQFRDTFHPWIKADELLNNIGTSKLLQDSADAYQGEELEKLRSRDIKRSLTVKSKDKFTTWVNVLIVLVIIGTLALLFRKK